LAGFPTLEIGVEDEEHLVVMFSVSNTSRSGEAFCRFGRVMRGVVPLPVSANRVVSGFS